jgi:hypothetical protein
MELNSTIVVVEMRYCNRWVVEAQAAWRKTAIQIAELGPDAAITPTNT